MAVLLASIAVYYFIAVESDNTGPGVQCYYIYKSKYDAASMMSAIVDDDTKTVGFSQGVYQSAQPLVNGYFLISQYQCDEHYPKEHPLLTLPSSAFSPDGQYTDDLILEDSWQEFYLCDRNLDSFNQSWANHLIESHQLTTECTSLL